MRYLTKSRFKIALSCPTKLFYTGKADYANTMADNDFLAMLADGGFQVGELAKILHPGGHEIASKNNAEALAETAEWMRLDDVVLFEPAFAVEGCLVRVDILIKRGLNVEVVEVKSKSFDSNEPGFEGKRGGIASGMRPYLQDVTFQKHVVSRALPGHAVTASLLLADKKPEGNSQRTQPDVQGATQWAQHLGHRETRGDATDRAGLGIGKGLSGPSRQPIVV